MRRVVLLALLAGCIGYGAPAASACHGANPVDPVCWTHSPPSPSSPGSGATIGCDFTTFASEVVTGGGETFTGVAYGYVKGDATEPVAIRCYVTVDGTEVAMTPTGTGTATATTAGQVTYTATETQEVELCAEWPSGPIGAVCSETVTTQFPPQEVLDSVNAVVGFVCPFVPPDDPLGACP